MKEKTITCTNCGNPFLFTVSEQERFAALGFNEPQRCRECRKNRLKPEPSSHEVKSKQ
ncbi:MAG: zinc-ribbon domain-containing protein, partial [Deltaproteobacteria bacterium]|nr:zinc-ribbon domain-containing protein [Deltaproteobacteria bacterium]